MIYNKIYKNKISIIGLGYVGLPLALEFGKLFNTVGYDLDSKRIKDLKKGNDTTNEISLNIIKKSKKLFFTNNKYDLEESNIFIITVPTPLKNNNKPDFSHIIESSKLVANFLRKKNVIIYESTVYPGATEEICIPIIEKYSGLKYNIDFFVGYSPERINPGDKKRSLTKIMKLTSGSTKKVADFVDALYKTIIKAGTFKVKSIKVAEAAKVIENTQRDLNVALMNELSIIFNQLDIDTQEVLNAANTKWNFLPFKPGLVGGHCIGVDPYYLTYKSTQSGYKPKFILSGRKINNQMSSIICKNLIKIMKNKKIVIKKSRVLVMGLTFKENCTDIRNSKILDTIKKLESKDIIVDCHDPLLSKENLKLSPTNQINLINKLSKKVLYDAIIISVAHEIFKKIKIEKLRTYCKKKSVIYDLKSIYPKSLTDIRL